MRTDQDLAALCSRSRPRRSADCRARSPGQHRRGRRRAGSQRPTTSSSTNGRKPAQVLQFLGLKPRDERARSVRRQCLLGRDHGAGGRTQGPRDGVGADPILQRQDARRRSTTFMAKHPNVSIVTSPFEAPRLAEELCRLRDPQRQLSRHLLAEREVRHPADGPERVPEGGLCGDEAGRGDRRHRPCRQPEQRHARDGREISTGSTRTS